MNQNTALFYGFFYNGAADGANRSKFAVSFLEKSPARIIDISAGVGDLAFPLAEEGHTVICIEELQTTFAVLLDRYKARRDIRHLISLFPTSLLEVDFPLQGDMAVACNVFSHLDAKEKASLMSSTYRHLVPDGKFIFNCVQNTPFRPDQRFAEINKRVLGDMQIRHFASSTQIDNGKKQIVRFEFRVEFQGHPLKSISDEFVLHMDTPEAIKANLMEAGFKDILLFGGYDDIPYNPNLPGFVIVATRSP